MEFTLDRGKVRLMHKNERLEKHGEEDVLACDLDFEYETSNAVLAQFNPDLRGALYKRPDSPQGELVEDSDHLTALRLPELGILKVAGRQKGEVVIGSGGKKNLVFPEATLTKFRLDCKDGGTVLVHFQAQVRPDETQSGRLSGLLQDKHCIITFKPEEGSTRPLPA